MIRRPSRPVRVLASALAVGALLTTAACSDGGDGAGGGATPTDLAASPLARASAPTSTPSARLTQAGAEAALITMTDLEGGWTPAKGAEHWGDTLLVGKVDVAAFLTAKTNAADCQRLLDSLYDDDLLGKPTGASALAGFQQGDSRLLYQVAAYNPVRLSAALGWMKTLPVKCDQFTATDAKGGKRTVQVTTSSVPTQGDARQGLNVTVQGTSNGEPATLTLDVAAVRVGNDAITVTAGGLTGGAHDSLELAVREGAQRLKQVKAGKTPAPGPGRTR
ncbi:hypothetical protein [Streptomyces gilvus]|uniref:hypothetical protein n=1 Tax=Streptomyces gilvus TaxID=2920937 RepID=UPI001F10006C|nr:hypothetical protein [Streptomyces sp. CME 23]MCH5670759.1 hypothetical protein [Streptomyces sp. CME 23]